MTGTVNWATVTNTNDLPAECREALAQFEREDISIGRLAKILGVSLWEIYPLLRRLGVSQSMPTMEEMNRDVYGSAHRS